MTFPALRLLFEWWRGLCDTFALIMQQDLSLRVSVAPFVFFYHSSLHG